MELSHASRLLCGIALLTIPTVEYGGVALLKMLRSGAPGYADNALRHDLFRAGHAHAGVMLLLALICQPLADIALLPHWLIWIARLGPAAAAILMPLGFFLSATSPQVTRPTAVIRLVFLGVGVLAVGLVALGAGLIRSAMH
jgi:hypothetical protein